jgi:hypothetical protein
VRKGGWRDCLFAAFASLCGFALNGDHVAPHRRTSSLEIWRFQFAEIFATHATKIINSFAMSHPFDSRNPRSFFLAAALATVLATLPAGLHAAPGFRFMLPTGTKNPSGLGLKIDARGIDANGYRPIEVEVSPRPPKPLVADRQVRIVLEFNRYSSQHTTQVSQVIELPEGSTGQTVTMLVPQFVSWSSLSVTTYEGGEKWLDLSQDYLGWPNTGNGWSWTEASPALLFIDSRVPARDDRELAIQSLQTAGSDPSPTFDLPDVRTLLAQFRDPQVQPGRTALGTQSTVNFAAPQISDTTLLSLLRTRSRKEMMGLAEIPTRWIELSQYDVIVISLADLNLLATSRQPQFAALRDWLSTGPLLITYGAGNNFSRLPELEKLLELRPLLSSNGASAPFRNWTAPLPDQNTGALLFPFDDEQDATPINEGSPQGALPAAREQKTPSDEKSATATDSRASAPPPFVFRPAGLGCLVAIAAEQPFPGRQQDWAWIFNAVPENHWKWFRRTGFSLQRTNDDYWKFLIPGVGEAPVMPFMLLVSLFAIVIGPVNFLVLRRARRLYLLLLTVPAGAALVTMGLIGFALISDGLGIRLRIRSFADFDQQTGRVAVWSRQSYYAAMAPSQGLVFPADTIVFPLVFQPGAAASDRSTLLHWDGDQQLRRGYLSARTATQFMTSRATASAARLLVTEAPAGRASPPASPGAPPHVENRLGTNIRYLLLCSASGDYFAAEKIADKAKTALKAVDWSAAAVALEAIAAPVEPADPHDYNPRLYNDNIFTLLGANRSRLPTSDSNAGDPLMVRSLLETNLTASLRPKQPPLTPRSYLAILEHSPFIITGIPQAREEASLHVIRGRY